MCNVSAFWKSVFLMAAFVLPSMLYAQEEEKGSLYATVDFSSKYVWRGSPFVDAPVVMPTVGFAKGNFDVYIWSAWDFEDTYREVNIGVSYTMGNLTLGLMDYFYPWSKDDVFKLGNKSTTHQIELMADYEFEKVPVYITASSCVYGDDKNEKGNQAFSTYVEGGYTHEFNEKNSLDAFVGFSAGKGSYTDYTRNFGVVNLTAEYTRIFNVFNCNLPVTVSYTYNPYMEKSWAYATLSLGF